MSNGEPHLIPEDLLDSILEIHPLPSGSSFDSSNIEMAEKHRLECLRSQLFDDDEALDIRRSYRNLQIFLKSSVSASKIGAIALKRETSIVTSRLFKVQERLLYSTIAFHGKGSLSTKDENLAPFLSHSSLSLDLNENRTFDHEMMFDTNAESPKLEHESVSDTINGETENSSSTNDLNIRGVSEDESTSIMKQAERMKRMANTLRMIESVQQMFFFELHEVYMDKYKTYKKRNCSFTNTQKESQVEEYKRQKLSFLNSVR